MSEPSSSSRKRVLVDLRGLEPGGINGGLQTYVTWLLPWLVKNHREKFAFLAMARFQNMELVASLLGEEDAIWIESATNAALQQPGDGKPAVATGSWSVESAISSLGIQTIYAPLGPLPCTPPEGVHSVALIADMLHAEMPMCLDHRIVQQRARYISHVVNHASLIQCISHSSQSRLLHHMPEASGKTFFSYLPVHDRFKRSDHGAVGKPPATSRPYFFYPANFWPHKNHLGLLVGYHQYLRSQGDQAWDLVLTGADYQGGLGRARETAASLCIADRVHFTGYVSDDELGTIWQQAGALVFPSLHEGFGIPLIEAMHHRIPILTSPAYSLLEIGGSAALYFNPMKPDQIAARMRELASSPALADSLRYLGSARLAKFTDAAESLHVVSALMGEMPKRRESSLQAVCGCPT